MPMLLALLIGFVSGLRSMTPIAVTAWAVRLGWLRPTELTWLGSLPSVAVLSLLAVGELVADKLPSTPKRTAPPALIGRLVLGAAAAACVASAAGSGALSGALAGAIGALLGCFGGYQARTRVVQALGSPDLPIALLEDAITIAGSLWIVSHV
jgi:uncharacterized membrane protein